MKCLYLAPVLERGSHSQRRVRRVRTLARVPARICFYRVSTGREASTLRFVMLR